MEQSNLVIVFAEVNEESWFETKNAFEKLCQDDQCYLLTNRNSYIPNGLFENFLIRQDAPIDDYYKELIINFALKYNLIDFLENFLVSHALLIFSGAVTYGRLELLEKLDLDFVTLDSSEKGEYLLVAAKAGNIGIVQFLLNIPGTSISKADKEEALFWADLHERLDVKEYLEDQGVMMKTTEKQQLSVLRNSPPLGASMLKFSTPRPFEEIANIDEDLSEECKCLKL